MSVYVLSDEELKQVQRIQLEMLCEVDRICRKNNIKYNIIAGTLLGAVRHKGYIPWDDDADVAFLREEYEKFRIACEKDLNTEKYYFQDHRNTEGYRWGYGKLRRKDSAFVREYQENMPYEQGIFIDIFPLDCVPDNKLLRSFANFYGFLIRKLMWAPIGFEAERNSIKKWIYFLLAKVPDTYIFGSYDAYVKKCSSKSTGWVRILTYPTPNHEWGYLKSWYETSERIEFEKVLFDGIKEWDEYLTFKFGRYSELPPIEERKIHPVSKLKLPD